MNVTKTCRYFSLITNASVLVQLVMALLLVVSFMSWLFIFRKLFAIRQAGYRRRSSSATSGAAAT